MEEVLERVTNSVMRMRRDLAEINKNIQEYKQSAKNYEKTQEGQFQKLEAVGQIITDISCYLSFIVSFKMELKGLIDSKKNYSLTSTLVTAKEDIGEHISLYRTICYNFVEISQSIRDYLRINKCEK